MKASFAAYFGGDTIAILSTTAILSDPSKVTETSYELHLHVVIYTHKRAFLASGKFLA